MIAYITKISIYYRLCHTVVHVILLCNVVIFVTITLLKFQSTTVYITLQSSTSINFYHICTGTMTLELNVSSI